MRLTAELTHEELISALSQYVGKVIYDGSFDPEVVIVGIGPDTGVELVVIITDQMTGGETDKE